MVLIHKTFSIILDPGLSAGNFEPQSQFQTLMKISNPGMFGEFVI